MGDTSYQGRRVDLQNHTPFLTAKGTAVHITPQLRDRLLGWGKQEVLSLGVGVELFHLMALTSQAIYCTFPPVRGADPTIVGRGWVPFLLTSYPALTPSQCGSFWLLLGLGWA